MSQPSDWMDDMMGRLGGKPDAATDEQRTAMKRVASVTVLHYLGARDSGASIRAATAATAAFVMAMMVVDNDGKTS
ncbi:MAG: hypothetical protein ABI780_01770 [Ardenticatenales bacterium]